MHRTNVRVRYDLEISATACLVEAIAGDHKGVLWCSGILPNGKAEANFAFWNRQRAYGFMLRVNCLRTASAVIDLEQVGELN